MIPRQSAAQSDLNEEKITHKHIRSDQTTGVGSSNPSGAMTGHYGPQAAFGQRYECFVISS